MGALSDAEVIGTGELCDLVDNVVGDHGGARGIPDFQLYRTAVAVFGNNEIAFEKGGFVPILKNDRDPLLVAIEPSIGPVD